MLERFSLRKLLGAGVLFLSLVFAIAAAPPTPTPTPAPTPSPAPSPAAGIDQMPVVVVYPFDVQTGVDPRLGMAIAQILSQEMTTAGGINVLAVPQNVKRTDFLTNARTNRADFYISGYVTPVGDHASVVEQVVSTDSGVILFSQTAQVQTVADVASQSLLARQQILAFVGRGTQNVETQQANTPAPTSTNGAQVPIQGLGSIVSSVFKHKGTRTPTPAPVVKPSRGVIVAPLTTSGYVATTDLTSAVHELYYSLNTRFNAQMTGVVTSNVAKSTDAICGENRNNTVATGTLAETLPHHGKFVATFNLVVYTCFGSELARATGKGGTIKSAVDAAVAAYAGDHPDNS